MKQLIIASTLLLINVFFCVPYHLSHYHGIESFIGLVVTVTAILSLSVSIKYSIKSRCESNPKKDRYPMSYDQPCQIDCRVVSCKYYKGGGVCSNISPAITLNENGKFVCWSNDGE